MTYVLALIWLGLGLASLVALAWAVVTEPQYLTSPADLLDYERSHKVVVVSTVCLFVFAVWTLAIASGHWACLTGGAA